MHTKCHIRTISTEKIMHWSKQLKNIAWKQVKQKEQESTDLVLEVLGQITTAF